MWQIRANIIRIIVHLMVEAYNLDHIYYTYKSSNLDMRPSQILPLTKMAGIQNGDYTYVTNSTITFERKVRFQPNLVYRFFFRCVSSRS